MIIVSGYIDIDPDRRDEALGAGCPHMAATRAQSGCVHYVWSADPLVDGRVYIYEEWADEASLAAHLEGPHYLAMRDTMASFGLQGFSVSKHGIERSGAVYDASGKARADFFD